MNNNKEEITRTIKAYPEMTHQELADLLNALGYCTTQSAKWTFDAVRGRRRRMAVEEPWETMLDTLAASSENPTPEEMEVAKGFVSEQVDKALEVVERHDEQTSSQYTVHAKFNRQPSTLEEALAFLEVDMTLWEIERWVGNLWPTTYTTKDASGNRTAMSKTNPQIKVFFKPRKEAKAINVLEEWIKDNEHRLPEPIPVVRREKNGVPYLLMLSIADLHLNKLAWAEETGEDYDTDIAISRFNAACDDLVGKANSFTNIGRICLVVGNDLFNIDSNANTTTGGTPQSVDSRHAKVFRRALDMYVDMVEKIKQIAPVDIVVVQGNHDRETSWYLGECLTLAFRKDDEVTVNNQPKLRKYYTYGRNMFLLTHGCDEKKVELPLIMATEEPELWGKSLHREVLLGHLHKRNVTSRTDVDDSRGVITRTLPSLTSSDAWHVMKGYGSRKGAMALLYHPNRGVEAILDHYPES